MFDNAKIPFDDEAWISELDRQADQHAFQLPPLKKPPRHGVMLWWPEIDPEDWIHPDDLEIVHQWVPSNRVLTRVDVDSEYAELSYGEIRFRVRPAIWLEVQTEHYEIGDHVEVRSQMGRGRALIGVIKDILWNTSQRRIEYRLRHVGNELRRLYTVDEFQLVANLDGHLDWRMLQLIQKARIG